MELNSVEDMLLWLRKRSDRFDEVGRATTNKSLMNDCACFVAALRQAEDDIRSGKDP
jgi:hypothetical protein